MTAVVCADASASVHAWGKIITFATSIPEFSMPNGVSVPLLDVRERPFCTETVGSLTCPREIIYKLG